MALELMNERLSSWNVKGLDVGSGSGILTVYMAMLINNGGRVIGIEHIPELVVQSKRNIEKDGHEDLLNSNILTIKGNQ